jgi:heme/copper-type cytochrome/quinol oxidase subunit 3
MVQDSSLSHRSSPSLLRARIGALFFIVTEVMFFAGLISAFWVIRFSLTDWPPTGQPRYPVAVTLFNTLFLFASGVTHFFYRRNRAPSLFTATVLLGALFLLLQGREWLRLIEFGLTVTSSLYGSIFYVIVGSHAIHATFGLLWLLFSRRNPAGSVHESAGIFWYFVVLIWPVLYLVVYILP